MAPSGDGAAIEQLQEICTGWDQQEGADDGSCSLPYASEAGQQRRHLLQQQQVLMEGGVPQRVSPGVRGSHPTGKALLMML